MENTLKKLAILTAGTVALRPGASEAIFKTVLSHYLTKENILHIKEYQIPVDYYDLNTDEIILGISPKRVDIFLRDLNTYIELKYQKTDISKENIAQLEFYMRESNIKTGYLIRWYKEDVGYIHNTNPHYDKIQIKKISITDNITTIH